MKETLVESHHDDANKQYVGVMKSLKAMGINNKIFLEEKNLEKIIVIGEVVQKLIDSSVSKELINQISTYECLNNLQANIKSEC